MTEWLVDTNILVRLQLPHDPLHAFAREAVKQLRKVGETPSIAPQNLVEFWNVATRPADVNGLGWSTEQANAELDRLEAFFPILEERPGIHTEWRQLVAQYDVKGRQVHDARLVAVMLDHGLSHVLTFNVSDFKRFNFLVVGDPRELVSGGAQQ